MVREYKFYGWQDTDIKPVDEEYAVIKDPKMLYDVLSEIWSKDTCAPRLRDRWTKYNMTLGQCSITAFLTQDIFGGKVYGIPREGGNYHCYNVVDGHVFDLTSEQFGDEVLVYDCESEQFRDTHFAKTEKHERYIYLKNELKKKLGKLKMISLLDRAIKGDADAAGEVALAYYTGDLGAVNLQKAKKWALYAAKRGSKVDLERIIKL